LGLLAVCFAKPARGQAMLDFKLEIEAPSEAGCTLAAALEQAIEERVGHLVFLGHADPARRLRVVLARDPAQPVWRAQIALRNAEGELLGARRSRRLSALRDFSGVFSALLLRRGHRRPRVLPLGAVRRVGSARDCSCAQTTARQRQRPKSSLAWSRRAASQRRTHG
jgi:hypothetical protein